MKVDYLIEFLPQELRRQSVIAATRRRSALLVGLLTMLSIGVAAHSWNLYRRADIERQITLQICTNAIKVDDVIDRLAADQQQITRFLGVYDRVALPLETSDLIATLTHLMPERMSLAMVKLEVESLKTTTGDAQSDGATTTKPAGSASKKGTPKAPAGKAASGDSGQKGARGKSGKGAGEKRPSPPPPTRWLIATIRGFTAGNADLYEFERRLNRTAPLEEVTVIGNKPTEVPGTKLQEFTITCRIPMNHRYERTLSIGTEPAGNGDTSNGSQP